MFLEIAFLLEPFLIGIKISSIEHSLNPLTHNTNIDISYFKTRTYVK